MPTHALPEATAETFFSASIRYSPGTDDLRPLGAPKFTRATGAYINCAQHEELGCALDAAGIPTHEVKYRTSGKVEPVYWLGQEFWGFPLCGTPAIQSVSQKADKKQLETLHRGIGVGWFEEAPGKRRSRCLVQLYLDAAVQQGNYSLIRLSLKGYQSDCLLQALYQHAQACLEAGRLLGRTLRPYELALPFGVGEMRTAGSGETSFSFPPLVCAHPKPLTKAYVEEHLAPPELVEQAERDWDAVVEWALTFAPQAPAPGASNGRTPVAAPTSADIASAEPEALAALRLRIKQAVDEGVLDVDQALDLEGEIDQRVQTLFEGLQ
jgi:hypothetical protein